MSSRKTYRRECGYALSDLGVFTLSSSAATTATSAAWFNATANTSTLLYDDRHIYVATGANLGQQRRIRPGSYVPSTGTVTVYPDWTSPGAVEVELTGLLPCGSAGPSKSTTYNALINDALSLIDRDDIIAPAVTIVPDHALTTWVAWITEDRIKRLPDGSLDVREPSPAIFAAMSAPFRRWEYVDDVDTPKLRTFVLFTAASGNLEVHVRRPSDTWIKSSGTWAEGSGLTAETDEALPTTDQVVDVFLPLAYRALMNRQPGAPSDPQLMAKFTDALDRARSVPGYNRNAERRMMPEVAAMERAA